MAKTIHPKAEVLLNAHVAFIMERLHGKALHALIAEEVDHLLADAARISLNDAVTREMIKETARGYAVELELSGAIPELVGDIARDLYANPIHDVTALGDLLPDDLFSEFLDKILEMRDLRRRVVHEAVANPVYAALASDILMEGLRGYLQQGSARARKIPGAARAVRLGQSLLGNALPAIEEAVEENLRNYIRKSLEGVMQRSEDFLLGHFNEEKIREVALDIWDVLKERHIAELREGVSSLDVEEFFVIGYEAWRELRTTAFYGALIDGGVDSFFDKYGDSTLREILDEMGITREIAIRDAMRFAPPVLEMLRQKKLLEPMIRRNLEKFYRSAAVARIIDSPIE